MLIGKQEVTEWIRMNDTPYWRIRKTEKSPVIFPSNENDNLTITDSVPYLEKALDMLQSGTYFIEAHATGQPRNDWFKTSFRIGQGNDGIGGIPGQDLAAQREQIKSEILRDLEFERLKTENQELKREIDTVSHRVVSRLEPYLPAIIEGVFGVNINSQQPANIAGIPGDATTDTKTLSLREKRLQKALERWLQLEKKEDPVLLIEKIVELAEKKPTLYEQAKLLLLNG